MYEKITYELILKRMINEVLKQNPNIDVREGSIIYNALAPSAIELAQMYMELDVVLNETFADTASREMLIKRAKERGVIPKEATKAILKGEFNIDVPIDSRYSLDKLNYKVIEKLSEGIFKLECETNGVIGNYNFGNLIPIEYIEGLEKAILSELLIPGEDDEDTELFRKRYFESLDSEAFAGNITDYKEKVNALDGVGGVKVYPVWNGGGTVKLVIINSDYDKPTEELVDEVQAKIDPTQNNGEGKGIAPIGHVVTVKGVNTSLINIKSNITFEDGWTFNDVLPSIRDVIITYFKELSSVWQDNERLVVRISQIETRILNVSGVLDIQNTLIDDIQSNLVLNEENIPILSEFGEIDG